MTLVELFARTILKSYKELRAQELLETGQAPDPYTEERDFKKLYNGESRGFFKSIIKFNNERIQDPFISMRLKEIEKDSVDEFVTCKINGLVQEKKVDHAQNEARVSVLSSVFNKNKCCDIFMNIKKIVNDYDDKQGDGQDKIGPAVNHASYVHLKTLRVKK